MDLKYAILLKDRFTTGMSKALASLKEFDAAWDDTLDHSEKAQDGVMSKLNQFQAKHANALGVISNSVPGAGAALGALANPYVAVGAAIATAVTGTVIAVNNASIAFEANQQVVKRYFRGTTEEIDLLTSKTAALANVFQADTDQLAAASRSLSNEFQESASASFDLIRTGLLATRGALDLDYIKEYSTQLKAAGFTASETIALAVEAQQAGIYQDKALDAVKEANLRLREMPNATRDALMAMESAGAQFNVSGQLFNSQELQASLAEGKISTREAMQAIARELDRINPQARQQAIADIFGAPGEDAGAQFFQILAASNHELDKLVDTSDAFIARQQQRLELEEALNMKVAEFAPMVNDLRGEFELMVLQAKVLFFEVIAQGMTWFRENSEQILPIWESVKTVFEFIGKGLGIFIKQQMAFVSALLKTGSALDSLKRGDFKGAWATAKEIGGVYMDAMDPLGLLGGEDKAPARTPVPMLPLPPVTRAAASTTTRPTLDPPAATRPAGSPTSVSGGGGAGRSITVNQDWNITFNASGVDQVRVSIEEFARMMREVLIREVANFEATA